MAFWLKALFHNNLKLKLADQAASQIPPYVAMETVQMGCTKNVNA